jgi:hypothetical protein
MNVTVVTVMVLKKIQTELYYKNETDIDIFNHLELMYKTFIVSSILKATDAQFKPVSSINQFKNKNNVQQ